MGSSQQLSLGSLSPWSNWGEFNRIAFAVQQALAKVQTATLVRVEACTNDGDLSPVGFVDVTPLVNQVDGEGNPTPHITIYGLPYLRMQGGTNAVILDPQPGDIGVAVFASRDISKVKSTKDQANPGSFRQYDFADGMYLGGMLNDAPTQYVRFGSDGITIVSPTAIKLHAPTITLDGDVIVDGSLTQDGGDVSLTAPDTIALEAPEITIDGALAMTGGNATMSGSMAVTGDVTAGGKSMEHHTHTSSTPGNPTSPPL